MGGTGRTFLTLSLSSSHLISHSLFSSKNTLLHKFPPRVLLGFKPHSSLTIPSPTTTQPEGPTKQSILLERLRLRHLKDSTPKTPRPRREVAGDGGLRRRNDGGEKGKEVGSFGELGLKEEVVAALQEMGIDKPTEIQWMGIPAVMEGQSVVLGSHTGSGKTLAYMLPIVQLLRRDEETSGIIMKPRRPRAVVLCPTRELSEQVFRVAKSISHHARFRSTMVSGGGRIRPQEDSLNLPIDMVVGTPGRILQHIEEGNIVYGDIKYLVLDEADTMFDHGFGPDIRKFIAPLKNRASKPNDPGFQTVLVAATMTKAVQKLIDEEFQGIVHLRTSTLHKKVASARHDFIKLTGGENKLEALLQVLEPSLAKGNKVMVFCNTLDSSRAVDHFLGENQIYTVNYHGEVPAEQRVENLKKFKEEDGDCPTLVCTDLAARGLDLDVDHVIMFDFPKNSVDYLHRTGRTARMGAKGKVTSLVAKRDVPLATRIEEAMKKNESLESLSVDSIKRDMARARITRQQGINTKLTLKKTTKDTTTSTKPSSGARKPVPVRAGGPTKKSLGSSVRAAAPVTAKKTSAGKSVKKTGSPSKGYLSKKPVKVSSLSSPKKSSKISVVGFRGSSSSG